MIAATIVCAIACLALCAAEWRGLARMRIASKLTASAAFVVLGVLALCGTNDPPRDDFRRWILIGLVLGAVGDAALLGRGARAFLIGLGAFLAGHLAYVVAVAQIEPPGRWLADAGWIGVVAIAAGLGALAWLWPRLGSMKVPVIGYVAAIVAMVIAAVAAARAGVLADPQRTWLAAGAALFFASDLAVARDRFVAHELSNKLWGLPAYFAGQLLIAWSIS
ncbi:MAG: lysoplasmalogenase family protein [Kofleriaceae bacterium]